MKNIATVFAGALLLLGLGGAPAEAGLSPSEKAADFRQLVTIVEQSYAPLRWKQRTIGLDWPTLVETYRDKVRQTGSDREFYQVLTTFLMSLEDAHVSVAIPSTFRSSLGFLCDYVGGKVLIEAVDRKMLPEPLFPFQRGDQLISIGGEPVETIMERMAKVSTTGHGPATKRLSAAFLTFRREERGLEAPRGVTQVTILPRGETRAQTVSLAWANTGRTLVETVDAAPIVDAPSPVFRSSLAEEIKRLSLSRFSLGRHKVADFAQAGFSDIGNPQPMFQLPEDAVVNANYSFFVATFVRSGKRIGVLRIPEFGDDAFADEVGEALYGLEGQVDVLVLDQTNNPGGQVSTVSQIMGYFAQESVRDVQFALRPSRKWMDKFTEITNLIQQRLDADPNDPAANAFQARFQYLDGMVRDAFQNRVFLTTPFSLDITGSFGVINPNPQVRFTKPVLMLVNEFDFSGGDVLPALMQDSRRATLFGARTAGAGGNVDAYGPLQNSGFKFHLTESLIIRPNGEFIENRGVQPEIAYQIGEDDFLTGYRPYVQAFTCEALKLVGAECPSDVFATMSGTSGVKPPALEQ